MNVCMIWCFDKVIYVGIHGIYVGDDGCFGVR